MCCDPPGRPETRPRPANCARLKRGPVGRRIVMLLHTGRPGTGRRAVGPEHPQASRPRSASVQLAPSKLVPGKGRFSNRRPSGEIEVENRARWHTGTGLRNRDGRRAAAEGRTATDSAGLRGTGRRRGDPTDRRFPAQSLGKQRQAVQGKVLAVWHVARGRGRSGREFGACIPTGTGAIGVLTK